MTHEDAEKLYERMREDEAQTRELKMAVTLLTNAVNTMVVRWDKQMAFVWRLIYILVAAVIALALGPKAADKLMSYGTAWNSYIAPPNFDKEGGWNV